MVRAALWPVVGRPLQGVPSLVSCVDGVWHGFANRWALSICKSICQIPAIQTRIVMRHGLNANRQPFKSSKQQPSGEREEPDRSHALSLAPPVKPDKVCMVREDRLPVHRCLIVLDRDARPGWASSHLGCCRYNRHLQTTVDGVYCVHTDNQSTWTYTGAWLRRRRPSSQEEACARRKQIVRCSLALYMPSSSIAHCSRLYWQYTYILHGSIITSR